MLGPEHHSIDLNLLCSWDRVGVLSTKYGRNKKQKNKYSMQYIVRSFRSSGAAARDSQPLSYDFAHSDRVWVTRREKNTYRWLGTVASLLCLFNKIVTLSDRFQGFLKNTDS